jgi:predicted SAM-dependent methyltransferase
MAAQESAMSLVRKAAACLHREGLPRALDRAWERAFAAVSAWRVSHLLGRARNLFVLPGLRRRAPGGVLNLGCGPDRRPGWVNADLGLAGDLHLDVARRFPFADDTFALVFSEHLLEHLTEAAAARCLAEAYRVLRPGGVLRLSTPDLAYFVGQYQAPPDESLPHRRLNAEVSPWKYPPGSVATPAQMLNDAFYLWEHRHLWDEGDLRALLERAGFVAVGRYEPGEGGTQETTGLEQRLGEGTLVLEATKPATGNA